MKWPQQMSFTSVLTIFVTDSNDRAIEGALGLITERTMGATFDRPPLNLSTHL
jgi:hypothetical protein